MLSQGRAAGFLCRADDLQHLIHPEGGPAGALGPGGRKGNVLLLFGDEISGTYRGMMIAVPTPYWTFFHTLGASEMAQVLLHLVEKVRMARFLRHPRGPKKPKPKKKYVSAAEAKAHVSTARLLAAAVQTAP